MDLLYICSVNKAFEINDIPSEFNNIHLNFDSEIKNETIILLYINAYTKLYFQYTCIF